MVEKEISALPQTDFPIVLNLAGIHGRGKGRVAMKNKDDNLLSDHSCIVQIFLSLREGTRNNTRGPQSNYQATRCSFTQQVGRSSCLCQVHFPLCAILQSRGVWLANLFAGSTSDIYTLSSLIQGCSGSSIAASQHHITILLLRIRSLRPHCYGPDIMWFSKLLEIILVELFVFLFLLKLLDLCLCYVFYPLLVPDSVYAMMRLLTLLRQVALCIRAW